MLFMIRYIGSLLCLTSIFLLLFDSSSVYAEDYSSRIPIVFPAPEQIEWLKGGLEIEKNSYIIVSNPDERLEWVASLLSGELGSALGSDDGKLTILKEDARGTMSPVTGIFLGTVAQDSPAVQRVGELVEKLSNRAGAYVLLVDQSSASILGRDAQGVFYGALTLLQLFRQTGEGTGETKCVKVADSPYHFYRGMRATLPRGEPRDGEVTHTYFRDLLRLMAFCRLNHVWVQGTSWNTPMRRHPETAWSDALTVEQANELVRFGKRHFLSMDGSLDWQWVYYKYKRLAEIHPDETWDTMRDVRKKSRVNVCPSNPDTWKMLFETMEDIIEVLDGDHFAIPLDEMYQEYHGSRWAVCPLCSGRDPVRLFADLASRLSAHAIELGRVPIIGGGMLMREHQGWYKDIYKAIDLIENRDKIVIYNWSEGHIRRGAMKVDDVRLQIPDFKATPFFREHGYKDVMHLFAGNNKWQGRPEMREVNGKLDCYGGFVSYYHAMNYELMKQKGTLANLAFTAQHLWSPDSPPMESPEDAEALRYAESLADAILQGKSYMEAIRSARKKSGAPDASIPLEARGRIFESHDSPVNLLADERGDRTEGEMRIVLPLEEASPDEALLILTMFDWDHDDEGVIYLNSHRIDLEPSRLSNWRDYEFPPIWIPSYWLKFGPEPNILRFVWRSGAGFAVKGAKIVVSETKKDSD